MSRIYARRSDATLLADNSIPEPNSGCWLWLKSVDRYGYGQWTRYHGGRRVTAHRMAYEIHNGPLPAGACVCHRCDVRSCVRPDHLWLGTVAENNADKVDKGRQSRGEKSGLAKLTAEDVARIRAHPGSHQDAADLFRVSQSLIWAVRSGRAWSHVNAATTWRPVVQEIRTGENHPTAKLTSAQVSDIHALRAEGWKVREIAARFSVSFAHVARICRGEGRQHG
jgi:hypothetical protein